MQRKNVKRRNTIIVFSIFLVMIIYICFCASALFITKGLNFDNAMDYLMYYIKHPKKDYFNDKTIFCILGGIVVWFLFFVYKLADSTYNFMPGEEYGSAKWGNVKAFNKKFEDREDKSNNKILSENIRFRYDESTLLNNNTFIAGGSGTGKSASILTPNLLVNHSSMIYTDPKGSLIKKYGNYLASQDNTRVYFIDTVNMSKSMHFNPFPYIRDTTTLEMLITNILDNTKPETEMTGGDPFWDNAEHLYIKSIFSFIWQHCPCDIDWTNYGSREDDDQVHYEMNLVTFLDFIHRADVIIDPRTGDMQPSMLERLFKELPVDDDARYSYEDMSKGAGDTLRSILISCNSRFSKWRNKELHELLKDNDIPIEEFGIGKNGDGITKSHLFITIPDDDKTYNFVPGMIYTLLFQELYYQARFYDNDRLPLDVGFWLDEFANIKMPSGFKEKLATVRSRGIYCAIFLQSLAQMKELFKNDTWEGVVGNCDTFIYLGGNEHGTFKYISELLGKWTIYKKSSSESKGSHGSSSNSVDVIARDLMDPNEIRLLPNNKEIVFVRGERALMDFKWYPWKHKINSYAMSYGSFEPVKYMELIRKQREDSNNYYELIFDNKKKIDYYLAQKESGKVVETTVNIQSFLNYDFDEDNDKTIEDDINELIKLSDEEIENIISEEEFIENKRTTREKKNLFKNMDLIGLYASDILDARRKEILKSLYKLDYSPEQIKDIISLDRDLDEIEQLYEASIVLKG